MKETTKPEIELYMYSINQEFPVGKGHKTFLERHSEVRSDVTGKLISKESVAVNVFNEKTEGMNRDWLAQWGHNQWVQDYTKAAGAGIPSIVNALSSLIMRKEEFGGLVLDAVNDRVYKVNKSGYKLLEEMRNMEIKSFDSFRSVEFSENEIESFISFLKGAGIWQ